ncbi:hypothetical protein CYY_004323, partial [Polysphondylium violaceum]
MDHYHLYNIHKHKHLITHFVLSSTFYQNHYHLLKQQESKKRKHIDQQPKSPIIFGITINDLYKDPHLLSKDLPSSIQYYRLQSEEPITKDHVPKSTTSLSLCLKKVLPMDAIPKKVKTLDLILNDCEMFTPECLPRLLESLYLFDDNQDKTIELQHLPPTLLNLSVYGTGIDCTKVSKTIKYLSHNLNLSKVPASVTQLQTTSNKLKVLSLKGCSSTSINCDNCPPGIIEYKNKTNRKEKETPYIPPMAIKVVITVSDEMDELPTIPPTVTDLNMKTVNTYPPFTKPIVNGYFTNNIVKLSFKYDLLLVVGIIPSSVT